VELLRLSTELNEFLTEYDEDADYKIKYSSNLKDQINTKEQQLKLEANEIVIEFFNYKNDRFLTKVEYYNWQHDVCIVRSQQILHQATPRTEFCDRGTKYIMLVSML
jgi:hypothetical protein